MDIKDAVRMFASLGGRAKSPAKANAARANGKLGGRPKGSKNKPKPAQDVA